MKPPRLGIPHSRLVPHDIRIARVTSEDGASEVAATIECERRACTLRVETCARCERFARIEPHEAGYVMLCRSTDSEPPPAEDFDLDQEDMDP